MGAWLDKASLSDANLSGANLNRANLSRSNLYRTRLINSSLVRSDLTGSDLEEADLTGSNLTGSRLKNAVLVKTNFTRSIITGCSIFGASVWKVDLTDALQINLVITDEDEPTITVDDLEVAQFIYLILNNTKIRRVIDTITSKAVLILGRFTERRKVVLNMLREELRKHDYLPIVFDFDKPVSRDLTETISTLAHMSRFIIADITQAKSIPQELQAIVPHLPSVPVQPIVARSASRYAMFEHFPRYPWVLEPFQYGTAKQLLATLFEHIIAPAEEKVKGVST
jgi:hypothetical protein